MNNDQEPALNMYGTNRTEAAIMVSRTNGPNMRLYDANHQLLWKAP